MQIGKVTLVNLIDSRGRSMMRSENRFTRFALML
jgi:hypothetical protein